MISSRVLLSFDVEEFDLPGEYGRPIPHEEQIEISSNGLNSVLTLLDRLGIRATFFTTAHYAQHRPDQIKSISRFHELASHGWNHSSFTESDLAKSKNELERISGKPVYGFRRARFGSFDRRELTLAGYIYDSSDNPIWLPGRYNNLRQRRTGHYSDGLVKIPISSSPVIHYPLFWLSFKVTPMPLFRAISWWTLANDSYLNLFFHPWEFTDLSGFCIPSFIKRVDDTVMLARLESYLLWLQQHATFETLYEFAARILNSSEN